MFERLAEKGIKWFKQKLGYTIIFLTAFLMFLYDHIDTIIKYLIFAILFFSIGYGMRMHHESLHKQEAATEDRQSLDNLHEDISNGKEFVYDAHVFFPVRDFHRRYHYTEVCR